MDNAEELAKLIAGQATTIEELNAVMPTMMKSALEQLLGAELNVHLQKDHSPELLLADNIASATPKLLHNLLG